MRKINFKKIKKPLLVCAIFAFVVVILGSITVAAQDDNMIINVITKNRDLFKQNSIIALIIRYVGWAIMRFLTWIADAASSLYDTAFSFVDFTRYQPVENFIDKWKPVFIALVSLSLLLIGILMCVGWDKKPKVVINLLLSIAIITSGSYFISTLNKFISDDVRTSILGQSSSSSIYKMIGNNIHDLVYLDKTVSLKNLNEGDNAKKVYSNFTEEQFDNLDITETLDPDDFDGETEDILNSSVSSQTDESNQISYVIDDVDDGVAWTDMLNEFYFRYNVDFTVSYLELISLFIVYLFMSYKVIRTLYEIVIHRLLAYLYSANLNNSQKVLKVLDSLKDSYIILLLTTILIKFYLLATRFISQWDISGLPKGLILLFLAFAVIDGPNIIQKLTGTDVGSSDGIRKAASAAYGVKTGASLAKGAVKGAVKGAGKLASGGIGIAKKIVGVGSDTAATVSGSEAGVNASDILNSSNNENNASNTNNQTNNPNINQNNSQNNNQNNNLNSNGSASNSINEGGSSVSTNAAGANVNNSQSNDALNNNISETAAMHEGANSQTTMTADTAPTGTAISVEQGKNQGGYNMNGIGNVQNQKDALNGVSSAGSNNNQSMKQMDKDVSSMSNKKSFSENSFGSVNSSNTPIDSNGTIFDRSLGGSVDPVSRTSPTSTISNQGYLDANPIQEVKKRKPFKGDHK